MRGAVPVDESFCCHATDYSAHSTNCDGPMPMRCHLADLFARLMRRFAADRQGNVVLMFAALLLPITALSIGALDYGRSNGVRHKLQTALDAGLGFAAQKLDGEGSAAEAAFHQAFRANLPEHLRDTPVELKIDKEARHLSASATTSLPVHVIGVLSGNKLQIAATAELTATPGIPASLARPDLAELTRQAPQAARQAADAQAQIRDALARILPPSDAVADPEIGHASDIDPAEVQRMLEAIMRQMQQ